MLRRLYRLLALLGLVVSLLATSCAANANLEPAVTPETEIEEPELAATPDTMVPEEPVEDLAGQTVSVVAVWAGSELEAFREMVRPWEERTGATMSYEGTRDIHAVLSERIDAGTPPDIAGLPGPGQMRNFAEEGHLVDLSTFLDIDDLEANYDDTWIELATIENGLYGIFSKASAKSFIWYNPSAFAAAGYEIPESWDELMTLSQQIIDDGNTPWCIGLESGAASGWPGTDWIEDIMLRTAGPEIYDQWWQHKISWTSDEVRRAWELWGEIVANEDMVDGGTTGMLATDFGASVYPLLEEPPGCYLHRQATFISGFIQEGFPDAMATEDYDFFQFPPIDEGHGSPMLVAGDLFGMFNDTPAARSLIRWLSSAEAQQIGVELGGYIATNRQVPIDAYPNPLLAQAAEFMREAPTIRFDASDLMPASVNSAFWNGILSYIENPDALDQILQNIETVAEDAAY
jgi:alpha-glucoside transport system substrate-binding protein